MLSIFRALRSAFTPSRAKVRVKRTSAVKTSARSGLSTIAAFGMNPGALKMRIYVPVGLRAGRPLVVVLHGCGQSATEFADNAGWIALANQFKLALVLPEQTSANNRGRCFNWFRHQDVHRTGGEAASIRQMIRTAVGLFKSDRKQIFVAGFSAGGGMAAALIGAFPALFAAGAVIAGMPVGCATTPIGALMHMRTADIFRSPTALASDVLKATGSAERRHWPRVSIWQGTEDQTVNPANAEVLAVQWSHLQGLAASPDTDEVVAGARLRTWGQANKPPAIELWTVPHLGHGFPVDRKGGTGGQVERWIVDAGIAATQHIAAFWGLTR